MKSQITTFDFCLTGLYLLRSLQVALRARNLWGIASARYFTGWTLFLSPNQQRCVETSKEETDAKIRTIGRHDDWVTGCLGERRLGDTVGSIRRQRWTTKY